MMRTPKGVLRVLRIGLRWIWAMATRKDLAVRGQAFAAGLRLGLIEVDVPVLLETPLEELHVENDAVTGVIVDDGGQQRLIRARYGVILGSGGFEHNAELRKQYQREPIGSEWTVGAKANTGEGIL